MSQQQNAFAAAAATASPLPTFSLPPNLHNRLVSNKVQQQQQQQNNKSSTSRPRLSNLRSTWLSTQSIEEETFSEDKFIDITLPTPSTDNNNNSIEKEVLTLLRIATGLCLLVSISATAAGSTYRKIHSLFLGEWILLFAWHTILEIGRTEKDLVLKITFSSSIIMLVMTTIMSHNLLFENNNSLFIIQQFTTLLAIALIYTSQRLLQLIPSIQKEKQQQQEKAQEAIDQAISHYSDRRQLFLSTVSQEIRDASLMVMATLEQFSPSSILTNTHELLSACSIAVPIASISAINTTIKQACHISAHLNLLSRMLREADSAHHIVIPEEDRVKSTVSHEFDVCELIQNVGDALAGMAAKLGVHFVIYHMDNGLYYSNVIGNEDAIKHALINLLRNILEGCTPGAFIELGLFIAPIHDEPKVKVTFDIIQTTSPAIPAGVTVALIPNANFTAQLLSYIDGHMSMEDLGKNKTRVEVSLELSPGTNIDQRLLLIGKPSQILEKQLSNIRFSNEPTYEELTEFITHLKGVKMILHAPEKSVFAKHLTSCLTSWNTDISHVPVLGYSDDGLNEEDSQTAVGSDSDASSVTSQQLQQPVKTPGGPDVHSIISPSTRSHSGSTVNSNKVPSPAIEEDHIHSIPPAFILIDDDVLTLERKLREFRDKPQNAPTLLQQRRHRRSKSRNNDDLLVHGTVAVIFFTSLTNYKRVRDTIHWISTLDLPPYMPRVVVVPKPAGPRRFLTALHTAWNNAIVEPQFIPIATSPLSPFVGQHHLSPSIYHDSMSSSGGGTLTPGAGGQNGPLGVSNPMMTPHDAASIAARFSPGRRGMRVHSPSGLGLESEKGNYFFDPVSSNAAPNAATSAVNNASMLMGQSNTPRNANTPAKLNTSPLLAATNMMSSPLSINSGGGLLTPSGTSSTNPTPNEIKRRLRSHSNSFLSPTAGSNNPAGSRTRMVDLSLSQASPMKKPTPVPEENEVSSSNVSSRDSTRRPVNSSSLSTNASTETNSSIDSNSIPTLSNLPPPSVPPAAAIAANMVVNNAKNIMDEASISEALPAQQQQQQDDAATAATTPAVKPKSKFNFKISNRKKKEGTKKQSDKPSPPITVLIVEDNIINQAILSTWMKKHQIKFSVACDGKEAVEKWKGGGFHLILMDIQLPVMDGIAATKMIRGIEKERKIGVLPNNPASSSEDQQDLPIIPSSPSPPPSSSATPATTHSESDTTPTPTTSTSTTTMSSFQSPVIIVALTASSLESDRSAALAAGCNDFLTKPVSLEWLEKKIMEWGCMQALIDFEGWRKWKRSTDVKSTSATTALKSKLIKKETMSGGGHETKLSKEAIQKEKENLALRTKELLKDESRAIVLVGSNKRRMSTLIMDQHQLQDRSLSFSSMSGAGDDYKEEQDILSSSPPPLMRKRSSDPDVKINSELLSIPKQLEMRQHKQFLKQQQHLLQLSNGGNDLDDDLEEDEDEEDDEQ